MEVEVKRVAGPMETEFAKYKSERSALIYLIQTAEAAERYEDMCVFLRLLIQQGHDLTTEERNFFSIAFKNVITALRASWRTLNTPEGKYDNVLADYKKMIEKELDGKFKDALDLIENHLLRSNKQNYANQVFFLKMAADYYRYQAEYLPGRSLDHKALLKYEEAKTLAEKTLEPTDPIRLGVALNYSVCLYEICHQKKKACDLAKAAFDKAIDKLDDLDEAFYKDSTLIMQLLRDNLTLWTSDESS